MKKYSLVKIFTFYSFITFLLTGIILSIIISDHIKDSNFKNLIETTQSSIDIITENILDESDFKSIITGAKKTNVEDNLNKIMSIYMPRSIMLVNKGNEVILSSQLPNETSKSIDFNMINKISNHNKAYYISDIYDIRSNNNNNLSIKVSVFDIYLPVKYNNNYVGVLILQIPELVINSHVYMLLKAIVATISGGLLILFLLLTRIISTVSKTLEKQNVEFIKHKDEIEKAYKKLDESYRSTVYALSTAVDARDSYTSGHSQRVAIVSILIGKTLELSEEELMKLEYAALFHDVGKIGIPDSILLKDGKLTENEYEIIKIHPEMGVNILSSIDFLADVLPIIKHHHENFIGNGYPDQLKGEDIPLGARIIAIADTYDAMTSNRPYRKKISHDAAVEEIVRCKGYQFDNTIVVAFLEIEQFLK